MANLTGLDKIVTELRAERTNLVNQLRHVDAALSVLGKLHGKIEVTIAKTRRRGLSAAARRKISIAQKARWARVKAGKK